LLGDIVHAPCLHYLFSAAGQRPEGSFLRGTRRAVWIPPYVLNPKSLAIREDLIVCFFDFFKKNTRLKTSQFPQADYSDN
jgi:hypothetical protein